MSTEINMRLQDFLDKNPEFKGRFIGYKKSRGGLGISRIDDDWFECDDYFISIGELIEALTGRIEIEKSADESLK